MDTADRALGGLAVVYDKNLMEASGYAATLAEIMKEKVWLVEYYEHDQDPPVKWIDRVMHIRDEKKGMPQHTRFDSTNYVSLRSTHISVTPYLSFYL